MRIRETALAGLLVCEPTVHRDERGLFTRTFDAAAGAAHGLDLGRECQDSQSRSAAGVLRGMHGRGGEGENKLVRCSSGSVLDVVVDARRDSSTLGQHFACVLDDLDFRALWIPAGFLHGFQVLSADGADVCYRIDRPHDGTQDVTVAWDDPDLALPWRDGHPTLSERDAGAGSWSAFLGQLG